MNYENNKLVIVQNMNAPVEMVWRALSDIEVLEKWMPFIRDFEPEVGFEADFMSGPDEDHQYLHICKVTEVVENSKLSYTYEYNNIPGSSLVTFELLGEDEKTEVTFTHEITKPFQTEDPNFSLENFEAGWISIINNLKNFVEDGERIRH